MKVACLLIGSLLMARAASAQEEEKPSDDSTVEIFPYFWAAGIKGTVGVRGLSTDVGVKFSDMIEHVDAGAMLAAQVRLGKFVITGDFNWIKLSADGETPGVLFSGAEVDSETMVAGLSLGYRLPMGADSQVELFAGARGWMVDTEISFAAGALPAIRIKDDEAWVDPIIGANFEYSLGKSWGLNVRVDFGGFDVSSWSTGQVILGVNWRLSDHWRLALAYRYLADDFEDGGFRWTVAEHGLLLGIGLRF